MIISTASALPFSASAETILINEGFENGIPDNWSTENSNPANTYWKADRAGDYNVETGAHNGEKNAYAVHVANSEYSYLITPAVDLSTASSANLSFWYINRDWGGDIDKLEAFYRVDGGTWNPLFQMADKESVSIWTEWSNELPAAALADNVQFGFKFTDKYGYGVGLDDVKLTTNNPSVVPETVEISYVLKESYGDGWNLSSLLVKDVTDNTEVATLKISDPGINEQPGSISLTIGHTYHFIWNAGNYPDECGLTLKDGDGILADYASMNGIADGTVILEYTAGVKVEKYNIVVGGTDVTSANAADVFGDGTVSYNPETKTLTLNNYTFEGTGYNYGNYDYYEAGIYCDNAGSEVTLELIGTNTVKETYGIDSSSALLFTGSLKITGSGTLNAISCDAYGYSLGLNVHENLTIPEDFTGVINATSGNGEGSAFVHGIYCNGEAVISGGTINAVGGTGQRTYGIDCGSLTVNGGTVNATGGETTYRSISGTYGIEAEKFTVNGGAVTAKGGKTANRDYCWSNGLCSREICINGGTVILSSDFATAGSIAVYFDMDYGSIAIADGLIATASENSDGSDAVEYNRSENESYKWFKAEPIPPHIHTPVKVPASEPTASAEGNKEYYVCDCGKWFADAEGTTEITDHDSVVLPKLVIAPEDAALPTEEKTEEIIKKTNTDKKDVSGSVYKRLMLKATPKKQTITITWKQIKGADGYIIYGAPCGQEMKRIATIKNAKTTKKTFKKLKKGKYYKYMVVAYKTTADGNRIITKSKTAHCCTDGGKKGNPVGIKLKKTKLTVKKGKTVKIKPTLKSKKKVATHIATFRYESSNTKVATVDKNGKVKGKKKGTATIYIYAQNGMCKTVKVTVK